MNYPENVTQFRPFFIIFFLTVFSFLSSTAVAGVVDLSTIPLSPKGKKILQEKLAAYPSFDLQKAQKEADEKYPLVKEGAKVTVTYRRNRVTGKFYGIKPKFIQIGSKRVPKMDLSQQQLAKFDKEANDEIKQIYIKRSRAKYDSEKLVYEKELIAPLLKQYPPVSNKVFAKVLQKIKPIEKAREYNEEIMKMYDDSLPIPEDISKKQFLRKTLKNFLDKHKDLVLEGYYIISLAEKKKKEEELRQAEEARQKKLADRIAYPRAATPVFSPDGGEYDKNNKVEITCPTEDVEIRYTLDGSIPTEKSLLYKEPINMKMNQKITAVAFHPEFNDSDVAIMAPWDGSGLYASYFNTVVFKGDTTVKLDKEVFFNFKKDKLPEGVNQHFISVLWTGTLTPPETDEYTFYLQGDDGVRMWLNGKLFIDGWKEQSKTLYKETAQLTGGKKYDIKVALVELEGTSSIMLEWSTDKMSRSTVPSNCFDPHGKETDKVRLWNKKSGGKYVNRSKMVNPGSYRKKVLLRHYRRKQYKAKSLEQLRGGK